MQSGPRVTGQYAYRPNPPSRGQSVRTIPCQCTPETPVRDLCDACRKKRRRITERVRRRRDRGGAEGGGAVLSSRETARVLAILDGLQARQIAVEDRARLAGTALPADVQALLETLARLREALRPPLAVTEEELIEQKRAGAPKRRGEPDT